MMLDVIDEGYHYIVASSTFRDVMLKLAKEYPENQFIIVDDSMDEADIPDNVALIFYAQNEGSYIVGQLAAGMSESGVVAVNVGMDTPVIADFVTGFIDGAQAYDPDIKIVKAAVGSWTDPAKMKELCLTQARDKQADVFYQVAGASGAGLFEACKELGTWAIGVDSDQYAYYKESENPELADIILTSMLKNVGDFSDANLLKKELADSAILTNGTSVGMAPHEDTCPVPENLTFPKDLIVSDIIYNPRETKLLTMAKNQGNPFFNGSYMLLYQGAEAFRLWTGKEMPVEKIKKEFFSDPFYSKSNLDHLRRVIAALNAGNGISHELITDEK